LRDSRPCFNRKLEALHGKNPRYRKWATVYGDSDFCLVVVPHQDFLYKEAVDVTPKSSEQPIWEEVSPRCRNAGKAQETHEDLTIVTSHAYKCFWRMMWSRYLTVSKPPFERPGTKWKTMTITAYSAESASRGATLSRITRSSCGPSAVQMSDTAS
jgi:hypothetical protein